MLNTGMNMSVWHIVALIYPLKDAVALLYTLSVNCLLSLTGKVQMSDRSQNIHRQLVVYGFGVYK